MYKLEMTTAFCVFNFDIFISVGQVLNCKIMKRCSDSDTTLGQLNLKP